MGISNGMPTSAHKPQLDLDALRCLGTANPTRAERVEVGSLFDAHATLLLRVVRRLSGPGPHVEEIVQDTFLIAYRKGGVLAAHPEPKKWLCRTAMNLVRRHHRSQTRLLSLVRKFAREAEVDEPPTPVERQLKLERSQLVHRCLAALPSKQREAVVLYDMEDFDIRDIAEVLGVSANTVWSRIRHGRTRFKRAWMRQTAGEGVDP